MEEQKDTPCAWEAGEWDLSQSHGEELGLTEPFRVTARGMGFIVSIMETWKEASGMIYDLEQIDSEGKK